MIAIVLQVGWTIFVVSNLRKLRERRRRIETEGSFEDKLECATQITHRKFLLAILALEYIAGFSYLIGNFYPELYRISPIFDKLSLPFNTTCVTTMEIQTAWVQQLRYPVTMLSFTVARSAMIFVIGVAISFFKFISNSFVSGIWKYKKIYRPIKYSLLVAVIIFAIGLTPQLLVVSRALEILVFPILYFQMIKHAIFLKKVVRWRREDLHHNSEEYLLRLHDKQNKYFTITIRCFVVMLVFVFFAETLITIEMFSSMILHYGKCIFPLLYGIQYEGIISEEQLPTLDTVLLIFCTLERSFAILATIAFVPSYLILTIILCVRHWKTRRQTAYRYSCVLTDPLLKHSV